MSQLRPPKPVVLAFAFKQLNALKAIAKFTFEHCRRSRGLYAFARDHLYSLRAAVSFAVITIAITGVYLLSATPLPAQAATNNTLNFQARLESASGAIVPDGNYNVEFKLYNVSTAGSAEWTEDYTYNSGPGATDARIHVANGYLTVNLGSITSFPNTINWDQQQWLTMNIGGTSGTSVTWDGEMNPRLQLTAVPYALRAGSLATGNGTLQSTLSITQPTVGNQTFVIPDMAAAGTYTLLTSGNGVQLQGTSPGTQQLGNFNISGVGLLNTLDSTGTTLNIGTSNATTLNIGTNAVAHTIAIGTGAAVQTITVGSTNGASATIIQAGTAGLSFTTGAASGATGALSFTTGSSSTSTAGNVTIDTGSSVISGTNVLNDTFEGSGTGSTQDMASWYSSTVSASNTFAHGGSYSLKVSETAAAWGIIENFGAISVTAGQQYDFSAWVRAGTAAETIIPTVYWTGGPALSTSMPSVTDSTSGWTHITGEGIAPAGETGAYLTFESVTGANTHVTYFDDITATNVSNVIAPAINVGGTNAQAITIGNTNQAGVTSILGGGAGVNIAAGTNGTITLGGSSSNNAVLVQGSGVTTKTLTNTSSAFQVQNALGNSVFTVDTSSNTAHGQVILGMASTNNGVLVFNNSTNANTVSIVSGVTSASYSLTLPTTGPSTSQCLQTDATTASQLLFGSCGSGGTTTLQQAYNNSAGASPSIDLTSTNLGLTLQNDSSSPIAGNLFAVRDKANAGTLFSVANTAVTTIRTGNSTNNYDTAGAFQVQNHSGNNIFSVDTSGNQAILGKASTVGGTLLFKTIGAGDIALNTASTATAYTLTLPTTGPSTSQCLQSGATTASQLVFGGCGSGPSTTLQQAYTNSAGASPSIDITSTNKGVTIQNDNASPITGELFGVHDKTASGLGTALFSVQNTGAVTQKTTTNTITAYQLQSSGSSALFTADTTNMRLNVNATYALMSVPTGLTVSPSTSGGALTASSTYRYKVTAIDAAGGETTASSEASGTTSASNLTLPVSWTAVTGASGYKVYRTAAGGASGSEVYLTTVLTNSYNDAGAIAAGTGSVPSSNTAYVSTNTSNSSLQLSLGGNGSPTGQLYVSGTLPTSALATTNTGHLPDGVYVQGTYAYVANNTAGSLQIFDISNPAAPVLIGTDTSVGAPNGVYVQGKYAYIADNSGSIYAVDISNPASPSTVGSVLEVGAHFTSIDVQGQYAYAVDSVDAVMDIFDVSNPASPTLVSNAGAGYFTTPNSVTVSGRYAYVTDDSLGLFIIDVSNPLNPTVAYTAIYSTRATNVFVQGRYAYVTSTTGSLVIYDVTNPVTPVGFGTTGTGPAAVYVQGRYAYVLNQTSNTMQVFDVSNPDSPVSLGTVATAATPNGIFVQGRYAYTVSGTSTTGTMQVFDLGGTYTQQLQAGGIETGTLSTDGNATISGDLAMQGGLTVGANSNLSGSLSVGNGINASQSISLTTNGASTIGNMLNASRSVTANISGNSVTAPSFDTFTKHTATSSSAQTQSFTITVNNHTNRLLMLWILTPYDPPISVTYNSVAMTNVAQLPENGGNYAWSLWVLTNPTVGTTLSVSIKQNATAPPGQLDAIASSWYNVSQTNPWQYFSSNQGASGQPSLTATSASGQLVVDSYTDYNTCTTGDTSAVGSGQTKVTSFTETTYTCDQAGESYKTSGGSTTSLSWTGTDGGGWAEGAIGLNGVPASTASVTGAVASLSSNCSSTTANACVDSGNVLSVTQSDGTATGSVVAIQNASSAPALQVQTTSGTTVMNVNTMGAQSPAILGDGVLNLGEIDGISLTSTGTLNVGGADYAEYFYQGNPGSLSPGDVVCLDTHGRAVACDGVPNTSITGVVSTKASVVGNTAIHHKTDPDSTALVGMLGQLQVKVSTANGPIEPGDMLTMSSTPGVAVKATAPGMTIGTAMQAYLDTGTGEITAYVHIGYFDPTASNGSYIQDGGALSVMSLNVSGNATFTNLTVTGTATFTGLTVQTLTVGHILSGGATPQAAADIAAGSSAEVTVTGTDTSGKIVITTGTDSTMGDLVKLTFAQDYESAPTVVLTAGDANAAKLLYYITPDASGFTINTATSNGLLDNQMYTFYYHVIQ